MNPKAGPKPTGLDDQFDSEAAQEIPAQTAESAAQDQVSQLQSQVESLKEQLLRAKAESQNIQRRAATERNEAIRYANADLMKILIPVLEDFERMLSAGDKGGNKQVLEGTRLVHANLLKALGDFGLETIDAREHTFDPAIHEALSIVPTDEIPPGQVIEQVTTGYRLRDRVLRPARVIVSKATGPVQDSSE